MELLLCYLGDISAPMMQSGYLVNDAGWDLERDVVGATSPELVEDVDIVILDWISMWCFMITWGCWFFCVILPSRLLVCPVIGRCFFFFTLLFTKVLFAGNFTLSLHPGSQNEKTSKAFKTELLNIVMIW